MRKSVRQKLGRIHQGDCIEGMSGLPDGSIDLVFADPPFNIGYDYDEYQDSLARDEYLQWSAKWMEQVYRVLKPDGTFWLAIGDEYAAELKIEAQKCGFRPRNWVIWHYTFGVHCKAKFTRSHAHLFYFIKDPGQFTFNADEIAVPSARQLIYGDSRANPKGRMPDDTWILRPQDCVDGFTPDEDTWYFPRVAGTFKERAGFHGCQMPEQLLGRIIRACSNPREIVLDPFSGSATTLVTAKKLDRQFIGFELSTEYTRLGTQRLERSVAGDLLEGSPEPVVSNPGEGPRRKDSGKKRLSPKQDRQLFDGHEIESFAATLADESRGILEAFAVSNRGFSADRVVIDPVLNASFQEQCDQRAIPGTATERNRFLFRMRKAGKLKNSIIRISCRTEISWSDVEPYLFASEIAWKSIARSFANVSLDEIFCDVRLAELFDVEAAKFAPGFSPLEYRWAALKMRKEGSRGIRRESALTSASLGLRKFSGSDRLDLHDFRPEDLPKQPGVYAIELKDSKFLYVGETEDLRTRLTSQLSSAAIKNWDSISANPGSIGVSICPLKTVADYRFARQFRLQKWYRSEWNRHCDSWAT